MRKITLFAALVSALAASGAAYAADSTSLGGASGLTINIPTAVEGEGCTTRGATAFDTNNGSMVCIGRRYPVWRRNIIWNSFNVSSGASCSTMPKGTLALDIDSKLHICK